MTRPVPRLHAITEDARLADARFIDAAVRALEAGGPDFALHLRGRTTTAARLYEVAVTLRLVASSVGAALLVNDRVDVALVAEADGAQLPEDSLDASRARAILGEAALIGVSRHGSSFDGDSLEGADFVVWGNVFETTSHPVRAARGVDAMREAITGLGTRKPDSGRPLPLIAIGGIAPADVRVLIEAGAHGVAALGGIWNPASGSPADAVAEYRRALGIDPGAIG